MASNPDGKDNFSMMQHLIDEMNASNHRIDMFSQKCDGDLSKYNSPSLKKSLTMERQFEALYDDAWKSEESDGASLQEVPAHLSNDAGDSGCEEVVNSAIAEVSNDFLSGIRQSAAQNQYADSDESRISSDNDFKILTGMASYARYPETATGLSDTDWNPYGTESDNNQSPRLQPQDNGSDVLTSFTPLLNSTDINTVTPSSAVRFPQLNEDRMSDILERTERESTLKSHLLPNIKNDLPCRDSQLKQLYSPLSIRKRPEKPSNDDERFHDNKRKEAPSSDEEKKMIASTSSTGYSSATSTSKIQNNDDALSSKPLSVIERAKLIGVPEDILLDKKPKTKLSKTGEFHRKYCHSPELVNLSDDVLGDKVRALLSDTSHLSTYDKTESGSSVDYTILQRDLQEIQDNLDSFGVNLQGGSTYENKNRKGKCKSQASSEGDGDIIPSTTTTPEKGKDRMLWDFAGDIGCLDEHQGLMGEISLDTHATDSQRPSTEKPIYNSDGDETRTSESSTKMEDHTAVDLALAEMSEILPTSLRNLDSSRDVDRMVSTFQDKRRQLESRYQQLNNQGLAEKVFRILTNQNPESQANGILSEISADEKDMRTRMVLDMHDKNFNYSSTSSWLDDVNQSFNPNCDVRKKLDMSGLSSIDSSLAFDKSATKGFFALDDAKRLLSSQMMKASERTFNNSVEMRVPQTVQCYPLFVENGDEHKTNKEGSKQDGEKQMKDDGPNQETVKDRSQHDRDSIDAHQQELEEENTRSNTSPNSSDQGSNMRPKDKYRPYRPPGSKEVYYTESDTASVADSVTTMESTHIGSDDAKGPSLPSHVFGSRKDPPNAGTGIYTHMNLSTVREDTELGTSDEKVESEPRNDSRKDYGDSSDVDSTGLKRREISEQNQLQSKYVTQKHSASSRLAKDEQPTGVHDRKRYDVSAREDSFANEYDQYSNRIDAARRDARWAHRRDEMDKEGQIPDNDRTNELSSHGTDRTNVSPTHGIDAARRDARWAQRKEEMSREGLSHDSDRRANVSPPRAVDAARRDARWAHRSDEINRGLVHDSDRRANVSPPQGIDAAKRDARWAYRGDEINRGLSHNSDRRRNVSPPRGIDAARRDARWAHRKDEMSQEGLTPDSEIFDEKENEPLSLRIRMTYSDEDRRKGENKQHSKQRDTNTFERTSPELRSRFTSSEMSYPHYNQQGMVRSASDENLDLRYGNLSPAFRSALPSDHPGLIRTGSDENLNTSHARLSPAFRRALSPELRCSIERRSPLLSRHLEKSLAQPPSDYPSGMRSNVDDDMFDRNGRPTFLARERQLSPSESRRHPYSNNSEPLNRGRYSRPRAESPPYLDRISRRLGSPTGRQNERDNVEDSNKHRGFDTQDQSNIKSKRKVELTLEGMSSESEADLEMDQEPLTKRTQLLKAALSNEGEAYVDQDINAMWEKFKAMNDSGSSSINSSKIEAVADLLKSPSRHLVTQYVKDREEYRIERQERAEEERERRLQEQQMHKHSSSEDEINERYAELLALKEEERMKRRTSKKKKGKAGNSADRKNEDGLFSIPEDRSHDPSPSKANTLSKHQKPKVTRQTHVIDPNMLKLRERITKQKNKVDKDMLKEMHRIEKLKKLESLLSEKKAGQISNDTLKSQLDELSSTSAVGSDFSHESGTDIPSNFQVSDDSTTAKDSSAEMHAWKAEKERRQKLFQIQKQTQEERKTLKDKGSRKTSKTSGDVSEIRLLKLVKEGYLTAKEAYKLAIERATQGENESLDISKDSSNNSNYGYSGKHHKLYSPYSRSSTQMSQSRHIPKLKFLGSIPHPSYGLEDYELEQQPFHEKYRKLENLLKEQKHQTSTREGRRPKSRSPSRGVAFSPVRREKSFSPSSLRRLAQPVSRRYSASPSGRISNSNNQHYSKKVKRNLQQSKKYRSENDLPGGSKEPVKESVAWQIPMDLHPSQWKEPLQKQQQPLREVTSSVTNKYRADKHSGTTQRVNVEGNKDRENHSNNMGMDIWTKHSHPRGIPKEQWERVVSSDALASKTNHWEVDPMMDRVQYILNKPGTQAGDLSQRSNTSQDINTYEKPMSKISLQEAFLLRKQTFISKCSERQKRLRLVKEDRQLQECLRLEREAIFAEQQRLAPPNLYAHPYSDNLYQPKHRVLTKHEMKSITARRYNKLPEVLGKKEEDKKKIECKLNRLRANLFNKKVQRDVLRKSLKQRC